MRKIGLVLPNTPAYSETFFVSKISGLSEAGFQIVLFAKRNNDLPDTIAGTRIAEPYSVISNPVLQLVKTCLVLGWLFVRAPKAAIKYFELEKKDGKPFLEILRRLYINAHILPYRLDWLHFGFATMGIGRENVAQAIGAKSAVSFRGYDMMIYPVKHPGCYVDVFGKVDKIHSISDDLYRTALTHGLSVDKPYEKITPAVNVEQFTCHRSWDTDKIRLLSVGRLTWQKGFDYALQALALLKTDFEYTILGEGNDKERLMFAAHQMGIAGKVVFAGRQSHDKVVDYMRRFNIYLQPSLQEGFCNAVLEAQAMGMICIVAHTGGLSENVQDNKSGFIIPKRNPEALCRKIEEIAAMTPLQLTQMSEYARQRVRNEFNIKDQIDKFIKFYQ